MFVLLAIGAACSDSAPNTPTFEKAQDGDIVPYGGKSTSPVPGSQAPIGESSPEQLPDEEVPVTTVSFREQGVLLYTERCAGCHQPIEVSNRRGVDAGKILNDYTRNFPTHKSVDWPDTEGAYMIEAALAIPPPEPAP